MAQIIYRVTGGEDGKRISRTFRNTDEGRKAATAAAKSLENASIAYDVRTRIGGRVVTRTFQRRKDADSWAITIEADRLRGIVIDPRRAQTPFRDVAKAWMEASTAKRAS